MDKLFACQGLPWNNKYKEDKNYYKYSNNYYSYQQLILYCFKTGKSMKKTTQSKHRVNSQTGTIHQWPDYSVTAVVAVW